MRFRVQALSDDGFPLRHLGGAVWATFRLRTRRGGEQWECLQCKTPLPRGSEAWAPIVENARTGMLRCVRICLPCMDILGKRP